MGCLDRLYTYMTTVAAFSRSLILFRLVCTALLAAITLQISQPIQSLERDRGSAFSATTYDVAVAPAKIDVVAEEALAPIPTPPVEVGEVHGPRAAVSAQAVRPDSTGPPAYSVSLQPYAPRGPPVA